MDIEELIRHKTTSQPGEQASKNVFHTNEHSADDVNMTPLEANRKESHHDDDCTGTDCNCHPAPPVNKRLYSESFVSDLVARGPPRRSTEEDGFRAVSLDEGTAFRELKHLRKTPTQVDTSLLSLLHNYKPVRMRSHGLTRKSRPVCRSDVVQPAHPFVAHAPTNLITETASNNENQLQTTTPAALPEHNSHTRNLSDIPEVEDISASSANSLIDVNQTDTSPMEEDNETSNNQCISSRLESATSVKLVFPGAHADAAIIRRPVKQTSHNNEYSFFSQSLLYVNNAAPQGGVTPEYLESTEKFPPTIISFLADDGRSLEAVYLVDDTMQQGLARNHSSPRCSGQWRTHAVHRTLPVSGGGLLKLYGRATYTGSANENTRRAIVSIEGYISFPVHI